MKTFVKFQSRLARVHLPIAMLVTLLQRTPVARVLVAAEEFVSASPVGTLLKTAAAATAALGALDSLAGATTLGESAGGGSPLSATTGTAITPVAFTVSNTINIGSWKIGGMIPPGLQISAKEGGNVLTAPGTLDATTAASSNGWGGSTPGNTVTTAILSGTPTAAGSYTITLQAFEDGALGGLSSDVFNYIVNVTAGNTAPAGMPAFTTQPVSHTIATGSTVVFGAAASGTPAPTFQWSFNNVAISGATGPLLVIHGTTSANAGSYTCTATNSAGSATSSPAMLTVTNTANVGRLINISSRVQVGTGGNILIAGFVLGGAGTSGPKQVLIRGTGPALIPFGVSGTLADPVLTLFQGTTSIDQNDNWGGNAQITTEDSAVGAFPLTDPTSADSALYVTTLTGGNSYSAQVAGAGGGTGVALVEVYDATPAAAVTATTPRLINLSTRAQVGTGGNILIAGFVIQGASAKTVLIRASGPALIPFGVAGTLPDPQLTLFNGSTPLVSNLGWGGDAQIAAIASSVGAFPWTDGTSQDSALVVTLEPGAYSAQVVGASGDTGVALIEVYDVP